MFEYVLSSWAKKHNDSRYLVSVWRLLRLVKLSSYGVGVNSMIVVI